MKYIDEEKITNLLKESVNSDEGLIDKIIEKSRGLKRLSLKETAMLLNVRRPQTWQKIFEAASHLKDSIYGRRVVLFAPLYISNICVNNCLYCAFKSDNSAIKRKALDFEEIKKEVEWLLKRGHKRILLVCGESAPQGKTNIEYITEAVNAVYSVKVGSYSIRRVNVNCAPLTLEEFKLLKKSCIGTYQLFQETYHEKTYFHVHPKGPKSNPNKRIEAIDNAFLAGIEDCGVGVLFGLYDYKFEVLALLMHIEELEKKFKVGPHTISVPRIEPALGVDFTKNNPYEVCDEDFKKIVAVLRLSVPYTGMILSTRETPEMRDELFNLGISQISAESKTSPGGYTSGNGFKEAQFILNDQRTLEEVCLSLIEKKFIPSFCAACYRKERTGRAFMHLAKPGNIKAKCSINALVTLKEYLDDFASHKLKRDGYSLISQMKQTLDKQSQNQLNRFLKDIEEGVRDEYV